MNAMPVIRPFLDADLDAVAQLFTASVHQVASRYYDAAQLAAWAPRPPDLDAWAARLAAVQTRVSTMGGTLLGFVSFGFDGHIDLLYTAPAACRRGVASALLRHAEAEIAPRGAGELFTEASLAARAFFERHDFGVVEEQHVQRRGVVFRRFAMRKSLPVAPG